MANEDAINNVADAISDVANAMEGMNNTIWLDDGRGGSAMAFIAQALSDLSWSMKMISKDFTRYVNHLEDSRFISDDEYHQE